MLPIPRTPAMPHAPRLQSCQHNARRVPPLSLCACLFLSLQLSLPPEQNVEQVLVLAHVVPRRLHRLPPRGSNPGHHPWQRRPHLVVNFRKQRIGDERQRVVRPRGMAVRPPDPWREVRVPLPYWRRVAGVADGVDAVAVDLSVRFSVPCLQNAMTSSRERPSA